MDKIINFISLTSNALSDLSLILRRVYEDYHEEVLKVVINKGMYRFLDKIKGDNMK